MDKNREKLVRVYTSANAGEAHLLRNYMEDNGVTARVTGDGLAHSGIAGVANVDIYIFESQLEEAQRLLRRWPASDDAGLPESSA